VDIPEAGGLSVCVLGVFFSGWGRERRRRVVVVEKAQTHATSPFLPEGLEGKEEKRFSFVLFTQKRT
jgi:hypothetical protein